MKKNATLVAVLVAVLSVPALAQKKEEGGIGGINIGIGAGYTTPVNILTPNTVSVRFQMGKLTFEPMVNLSGSSTAGTVTTVVTGGTPDVEQNPAGSYMLGVGTDIRFELAGNSTVGFAVIGGIGLGYGSNSRENTPWDPANPDDFNRTTVTSMGVALNWGFGIDWNVTKNFVISADAANPLISFEKETDVHTIGTTPGGTPEVRTITDESTTASYGLVFSPRIRLMFLLMF